ncbi:hypothetical protein FH972_026286 [Carpinus fangiana]|uniref:Nephrocystin 3-like N-terminal domain-containing protein n=1 Tax=Carpinus fangiana TaxID=176857 RepID=A0A5N6L3W7_9ROSI|nr:hypothetical protein FH972_026286 [Carpinus fangiana]
MKREDFTVGWICALKHEIAASRAMLDEEYDAIEDGDPNDTNVYCWGRIAGHQIVMACLPAGRYGIDSAAAVATNMLRTYPSFRFGLMVGIGGGVPSPDHDIRLGDVVVSKPTGSNGGVIQYDLGKALPDGRFERKGHLNKPSQVLLNAIQKLQATHDMQDPKITINIGRMMERYPKMRRTYNSPGPGLDHFYLRDCVSQQTQSCDACAPSEMNRNDRLDHAGILDLEPRIHYGLIGSGNKVIASAAERDKLCEGADILCFETEAAGLMDTFPCLVIRGICDYADSHKRDMWQNYAATTAAAFSHELLGITPIWAVTKTPQAEPMHLDLPSNAERDRVFEKLSIAEHAAFDSAGATETHSQCLKDTRVDILKQIMSWTDNPLHHAIFWLKGWAGTGKSTIALTIANLLSNSSRIVASFFFQRGGGDLARGTKLIPTIAHQLAVRSIEYFNLLKQAVDHDPALGKSKSMTDQYEQLIVTPLRKMKESSTQSTFIIVIDALDECEDQQTVRSVLKLLGETSSISELGLRVFVTSRPETPIRLGFENMKSVIYRDLALHDLPRAIVDEDIMLYFDRQLSEIRSERRLPDDWPGRSNLDTLVLMAEGLFIFAVTACRYINGPRQISAKKRLEQVCRGVKTGQIHTRPLDEMYTLVLENFASGDFLDEELEEVMADFREIVGGILVTYDNLSASALEQLLFSEQERTEKSVKDILDPLHALLDIPIDNQRPIRTIHLSFRDFLLDHDRCRQERFRIKQKDMHENLFKSCIDLMSKSLHENMCNAEPAGIYVSEVADEYISSAISPALKYACRYWFQHALDASIDLTDDGPMHYFISEHILYWLETMGWLGLVAEAVSIINEMSRRVDV